MPLAPIFRDRTEAGLLLAARLGQYAGRPTVRVLAISPGGGEVGLALGRQLAVPTVVLTSPDMEGVRPRGTLIFVDDGAASAAALLGMMARLRLRRPRRLILAVPVLTAANFRRLSRAADLLVNIIAPDFPCELERWYEKASLPAEVAGESAQSPSKFPFPS